MNSAMSKAIAGVYADIDPQREQKKKPPIADRINQVFKVELFFEMHM